MAKLQVRLKDARRERAVQEMRDRFVGQLELLQNDTAWTNATTAQKLTGLRQMVITLALVVRHLARDIET